MDREVNSTASTAGDQRSAEFRLGVGMYPYYSERGGLGVVAQAKLAERLGFDDIWLPDHVVFRRPIGDVQVMAAMAGAATERLQICTGVVQAGMQHPVRLAKWLGALALEIPGRVVAGLGVGGDFRDEWQALGLDASERGRRFDEALSVLPRLLRNEPVKHEGRFYSFDIGPLFGRAPEPIPLWIGARLEGAIRRAVLVDGWYGMIRFPEEFKAQREQLQAAAAAAGSTPPQAGITIVASILGTEQEAKDRCGEFFRTVYGLPPERGNKRSIGGLSALRDLVQQYREAGANRVSVMLVDPPEEAWPLLAEACIEGT